MKRLYTFSSILILTTLVCSTAFAQQIEVRMENDETQEKMYCEVYRLHQGKKKRIKRFTLAKKDPNEGKNTKTFKFHAPLKSRTISGKNTYYALKLKCWNSKSSYVAWTTSWDHKDMSFFTHYFRGYCYARSAKCSTSIKKK